MLVIKTNYLFNFRFLNSAALVYPIFDNEWPNPIHSLRQILVCLFTNQMFICSQTTFSSPNALFIFFANSTFSSFRKYLGQICSQRICFMNSLFFTIHLFMFQMFVCSYFTCLLVHIPKVCLFVHKLVVSAFCTS